MLVASGSAYTAIDAATKPCDQRREAEGLIEFMLGDLRGKLEPVGRLDRIDAGGARALAYTKAGQSQLSTTRLSQRSKALILMGEIAASRGELDGALRRIGKPWPVPPRSCDVSQMTRSECNHTGERLFVGSIAMDRGLIDEAPAQYREYRGWLNRMIASEPNIRKWRLEGCMPATNLGIVNSNSAIIQRRQATLQACGRNNRAAECVRAGNSEYREAYCRRGLSCRRPRQGWQDRYSHQATRAAIDLPGSPFGRRIVPTPISARWR